MLEVAMTKQSQPLQHRAVGALLLTMGREATNGAVTPAPKVAPLPTLTFIPFKILAMACVSFKIITPIRLTSVLHPVLGPKTSLPPSPLRFGGQSNTRHCYSYALPCECWIDFLNW
jgi:hypothetical protein